jgi:esterase/lipase superfamily enzyme
MIAAVSNRIQFLRDGREIAYLAVGDDGPGVESGPSIRRRMLECLAGSSSEDTPRIVAFIHGFNSTLEESIARLRQVHAEITSKLANAVTVGFLWPSEGTVDQYLSDRQHARKAAPALCSAMIETIRFLEEARCPAELCIIAHSMGNFLLAEAARYAWESLGKPTSYNVFSEVLMVAPDLDAECFEPDGEASAISTFGRRVTVYTSRKDGALLASSVKRGGMSGPRLGRHGADNLEVLPKNVVVIDATESSVAPGIEEHSAHFHAEKTLADMLAVIRGLDRQEIQGRVPANGPCCHWRLVPPS